MESKGNSERAEPRAPAAPLAAVPQGNAKPRDGRGSKAPKTGGAVGGGAVKKISVTDNRPFVDSSRSARKPSIPHLEEDLKGPKESDEDPLAAATPKHSPFLVTARWLLDKRALSFAELALAQELTHPLGGPSIPYYIGLARLQMQKEQYKEAEASLQEALRFSYQEPDTWALLGHTYFLRGEYGGARDCYERTLQFVTEPTEIHAVHLRLAALYLQEEQFQEAKETYLIASRRQPSSVTWMGVGIACYRLGELSEAEDALIEANILNNLDAAVWGYLALVCLQTGRVLEAEQAYKYCVKLNLDDDELMAEIRGLQEATGFGDPSM